MDEDGDTPLFYAESLEVVKCLVEELGANASLQNHEGVAAADKISEDGEGAWVPAVVEYLRRRSGSRIPAIPVRRPRRERCSTSR